MAPISSSVPLPTVEWLSRDWLRSWLAEGAAAIDELPRHRGHPLVRRMYPSDLRAELAQLWAHRESLLVTVDRLPQVLCHHDAFRRNLFLRSGRLLAVDWAFLGVGPLGSELAPFVSASATFLGVERAHWDDLEQTAMAAYRQGLADAGWQGGIGQPRFGFAASSRRGTGPASCGSCFPRCSTRPRTAGRRRCSAFPSTRSDLWSDFAVWQARLAAEALTTVPQAP
jgi:Phosphotransferase enzyme family